MRIAYVNANFKKNHTGGGHVHMEQFIRNVLELGHEVWVYPGNQYPGTQIIPTSRLAHIRTMRKIDVLYVRLEHRPVNVMSWSLPPRRTLYNFPLVIWEFNTIPDEGLIRGESTELVNKSNDYFRHYGRGCDLAICMTNVLGDYVKKNLGIERILIVPNGSDPELFRPNIPNVNRMEQFNNKFNVVWIGSAKIIYHDFNLIRDAAQSIVDRGFGDEIIFHLIGPELVAKMADMPSNVYYWGAETYNRLPHWLSAMDVGLYLTHGKLTEISTPLKFFDYLASGLAVVSTSQPIFIQELFAHLGQTDLLIPPGDSAYLADVLIKLADDRERVRSLGKAGRQLVIEQYNWRRAVKDTIDEIELILNEKGRSPKVGQIPSK